MMVETKEISEFTRSNRIAMLSHISTVMVMVFFGIYAVESHCDAVTYQYGNGYGVFYDMGKRKRTTVSGIYDNRYGRWCHTFDWRGDLLER